MPRREADLSSLDAVVRELRWSAARSSGVDYAARAVLAATVWLLLVLLTSRVVPLESTTRVAEIGAAVAIAAVALAAVIRRPGPMRLMRVADLNLGLKERLSTAWERRQSDGPMDGALRGDALQHAARATLAAAFPVRLPRREGILILGAAAVAIALVVLPNPMDQVLVQRHADRAAQQLAAATIAATQKKVAATPTPAAVDPKVQKILQDAKAKINSAPDPRSALQHITPAEQRLLQLSDPQTPARIAGAQNLATSLSTTSAGRSTAQAITAGPGKGAQAVRALASQLPSLSPQERAALAQALANAAQHAQDPAMATSMRAGASALSAGAVTAAATALNDLAGQLDSLQAQEANDQEIASAINGLESARQELARQADADAARGSGAGPSPGAGNTPGSGNGNGNGNGSGNGNGNGNGSGSGSGNGSGGTGGTGSSGSGSGSGSAAHSTERLYVPGQPVPGASENDPAPLGPGQDVPLTPYTQVIQAYRQAALDASNQSLIPGSERDLIREYFASLGGTGQ